MRRVKLPFTTHPWKNFRLLPPNQKKNKSLLTRQLFLRLYLTEMAFDFSSSDHPSLVRLIGIFLRLYVFITFDPRRLSCSSPARFFDRPHWKPRWSRAWNRLRSVVRSRGFKKVIMRWWISWSCDLQPSKNVLYRLFASLLSWASHGKDLPQTLEYLILSTWSSE